MKELWYAVLTLLMLGVLAGFASMSSPTGAFVANLPPRWDFPSDHFTSDAQLVISLDRAFFDADGDPLAFSVTPTPGVTAGLKGDQLIISGKGEAVVSASDGKTIVSKTIYLNV